MNFGEPQAWHWLWLLPLLAGLLHVLFGRRLKRLSAFVQISLLPKEALASYLWRHRVKAVLLTGFFVLAVIALTRPQWGFHWQESKRQGVDILIAVDVSKSMLTQDVLPSRLERTKLAIKDLVRSLKGDRIGLVAFAGQSFLVCPLTLDYNGFLLSLNDLGVNTIPRGGTDLSTAIEEAIKGYGGSQTFKTLVLVTDGEDQEGDALAAAKKAKAKGIRVFTVGIGTQEGDLIRITDEQGQSGFLKDAQGNYVKSRLNEKLLQEIAYITNGAYVRSSGAQFGLDFLYERQLSKIDKHEIDNKMEKHYDERFQWFLGLALVFLMAETLVVTWKT